MRIKILPLKNFDKKIGLPAYQTSGSAGADVSANLGEGNSISIEPGQKVLVPTGLCLEIPKGYEVQIRPRSGLSFRTGLFLPNSPGTIDSDYRGELKILMGNNGQNVEVIKHGDRVAQMVIGQVVQANFELSDELSETTRDQKGFGSTGVHL